MTTSTNKILWFEAFFSLKLYLYKMSHMGLCSSHTYFVVLRYYEVDFGSWCTYLKWHGVSSDKMWRHFILYITKRFAISILSKCFCVERKLTGNIIRVLWFLNFKHFYFAGKLYNNYCTCVKLVISRLGINMKISWRYSVSAEFCQLSPVRQSDLRSLSPSLLPAWPWHRISVCLASCVVAPLPGERRGRELLAWYNFGEI